MDVVNLSDVREACSNATNEIKSIKVPSRFANFSSDVKSWDSIIAEGGQCKSGEGIRKKVASKGKKISAGITGIGGFTPTSVSYSLGQEKLEAIGTK